MITLRPYQRDYFNEILNQIALGTNRILASAFTGSGKTEIASALIQYWTAQKIPILFIVRRKDLVRQTAIRLKRDWNMDCNVIMGNETILDKSDLIYVASIDTLHRRFGRYVWLKKFKHIIIDEAHDVMCESYMSTLYEFNKPIIVGFTATPFANASGKKLTLFQTCIELITPKMLRDQGYLVPTQVKRSRTVPTADLPIRMGDFEAKALSRRCLEPYLLDKVVPDWIELAEDRPTMMFTADRTNSEAYVKQFLKKGIKAVHIDCDSTSEQRLEALDDLANKRIQLISNVNVFSTGVDVKPVSCIYSLRPSRSLILTIQQIGRGLRTFDGKEDCLIIDTSGNILLHGDVYKDRQPQIA